MVCNLLILIKADDPRDGSLLIYECGWSGCDYQYEDIQDLMIHVMENGGHLGGGRHSINLLHFSTLWVLFSAIVLLSNEQLK